MQYQTYDVIIIGAGPAGLTAAAHLATSGQSILVLDRCTFPREKVCGDGLIADSLGCLQRLGLQENVLQLSHLVKELNIRSRSGLQVRIASGFRTIKRLHLDALLWRHAQETGAQFRTQRIDTVFYDQDGLFCCSDSQEGDSSVFKARYGIIATGTAGIRNDRIGIMPVQADNAMAVRCYVRSDLKMDHLEGSFESYLAPGYGWIFPLPDQEFNMGCIRFFNSQADRKANLRELFEKFRDTHPVARALFDQATSVTPLRAHPLRCGRGVDKVTDGIATLLTGETIGTTFPFTGEGIGKAMEAGEIAAQVLQQALQQGNSAPLRNYPRLLSEYFQNTYEGYAKAQHWLFRKGINDVIILQTLRSKLLRREISRMIMDETTPASVLTARTLLKTLFS